MHGRLTRPWRRSSTLLAVVLVAGLSVTGSTGDAASDKPAAQKLVDGKSVVWWARRARANGDAMRWQKKRATALTHRLRTTVSPMEHAYEHAAVLAAIAYGVDAETLLRKGRCESGNWTAFTNASSGAAGPWQFLWSTWRGTPFGAYSPYDPLAAALAAAWMHRQGRGGEWVCQ